MDDNDIIIMITEHFRLNSKDGEIVIAPAALDEQLKVSAGSVEKHLDEAAKRAGMKILERGSTQVRLRKIRPVRVWTGA